MNSYIACLNSASLAEVKFESKFQPLLVLRPFQKAIAGFHCKLNAQALGTALWHSFGVLDWQAQTTKGFRSSICCWVSPVGLVSH